jgi:hypothetical protein
MDLYHVITDPDRTACECRFWMQGRLRRSVKRIEVALGKNGHINENEAENYEYEKIILEHITSRLAEKRSGAVYRSNDRLDPMLDAALSHTATTVKPSVHHGALDPGKQANFVRRRCGKSIRALTNAAFEDRRSSDVRMGVTVGVGSLRTHHNGTTGCTTQAA